MSLGLTFKQVEHHRNGVCGDGFYCAIANDPENGDMLIVYFPDIGQCACSVFKLDRLPDLTFGVNSWRGDRYVGEMEKAVEKYKSDLRLKWEKK